MVVYEKGLIIRSFDIVPNGKATRMCRTAEMGFHENSLKEIRILISFMEKIDFEHEIVAGNYFGKYNGYFCRHCEQGSASSISFFIHLVNVMNALKLILKMETSFAQMLMTHRARYP